MIKFAAAIILSVVLVSISACGKKPRGEELVPRDGKFIINTTGFERGTVRFFRHHFGDKDIVFLVARADDGSFKTAFDACITCYPHHMGYRSEKGCVVCIYCNTAFNIDTLDTGVGNCVPIKIPSRGEGETIFISQGDVEAGSKWF
jgi:uncharacterized membrane protein